MKTIPQVPPTPWLSLWPSVSWDVVDRTCSWSCSVGPVSPPGNACGLWVVPPPASAATALSESILKPDVSMSHQNSHKKIITRRGAEAQSVEVLQKVPGQGNSIDATWVRIPPWRKVVGDILAAPSGERRLECIKKIKKYTVRVVASMAKWQTW